MTPMVSAKSNFFLERNFPRLWLPPETSALQAVRVYRSRPCEWMGASVNRVRFAKLKAEIESEATAEQCPGLDVLGRRLAAANQSRLLVARRGRALAEARGCWSRPGPSSRRRSRRGPKGVTCRARPRLSDRWGGRVALTPNSERLSISAYGNHCVQAFGIAQLTGWRQTRSWPR